MSARRWLWITVAALTIARFWLAGRCELLPEEAYYWTYAQHPALGYFDHPPMVAWTVKAGTLLLGDTERGVRLVNMLLWVGSCLLLWLTARHWFDERVATWSAWIFVVLPIFLGVGFIVTPDGPLVFFWMLTLYALTRALQQPRYWFLAGVAFGAALLSKYYAVILAPSLVWFLLLSPKYRFWLKRWQPWAAVVLALLVFSPVIIWNSQHQWASFAFQTTRTVGQKGSTLAKVGTFWAMQLAVVTPVGLVALAAAAARGIRRGWFGHEDAWNFATSFSLPVFALFVAASVKTGVHVNWTAPAFLSLSMAAAAAFLEGRAWWRAGAWALAVMAVVATVLGHVILATGKPARIAYNHTGGWRTLATRVGEARRELAAQTGQDPFVIGADKYNIAAEAGFYLHLPGQCVNLFAVGERGLGYRYWTDLQLLEGRPAVAAMFGRQEKTLEELRAHFERLDVKPSQPVGMFGTKQQEVTLAYCYGYRPARP
jgi:dolichol-phosphate mannosyltransferase